MVIFYSYVKLPEGRDYLTICLGMSNERWGRACTGDPPKAYLAGKEVAKLSWRPLLEVTLILGEFRKSAPRCDGTC